MSTLVKVARYHLVQPYQYLAVTWGILAFTFVVNVAALRWFRREASTAGGDLQPVRLGGEHVDGCTARRAVRFFIFFLRLVILYIVAAVLATALA